MCDDKDVRLYSSSKSISWICRGKFGILELNCSGIEVNKTVQREIYPCCEAKITDGGRIETHRGGIIYKIIIAV